MILKAACRLDIPFKSQLDNADNPMGACNVTSVAMCLAWGGVTPRSQNIQLEDEVYRYMEGRHLNRHSPQDLATVVRDYGLNDNFTATASIDAAKAHLSAGNPCITHGYFTDFGHIIVLVGYDERGFLVHDPYGEWFEAGYDTTASGAYLHYSYALIKRVCIPDGLFWVHFISK